MSAKTATFRWTERSEQAARDVAQDLLTDTQIAANAGITQRQLERWKSSAEFAARVEAHVATYRRIVRSRGIAIVENRVDALSDRWRRLQRVIDARAQEMAGECAGGETGLLVRQVKFVKVLELPKGTARRLSAGEIDEADLEDGDFVPTKQSRPVLEYAVDTGLLAEVRHHEEQAAKELGQWVERTEVETRDTSALDALKRRLALAAGTGGVPEVPGEPDGAGGE